MSNIMKSPSFSIPFKKSLAAVSDEYYAGLPVIDLDLPEEVKINLLTVTDNPDLKDNLFKSLVLGGLKDREQLRECSRQTSEPGLEKIFYRLTESTFDAVDSSRMLDFLTLLSDAGLVQDTEPRGDGKFHVKIPRHIIVPPGKE